MAQARNLAASAGINEVDRLGTEVRGEKRSVRGKGTLQGARGADRAGETPDQGSRPGIPAGESIQISGEDPRSIGMEPDGGFIKSGGQHLVSSVSRGIPDDNSRSLFLGGCDQSGIGVDRHGIQQEFGGREGAGELASGGAEQTDMVVVGQGDGAMTLADGQVVQVMSSAT